MNIKQFVQNGKFTKIPATLRPEPIQVLKSKHTTVLMQTDTRQQPQHSRSSGVCHTAYRWDNHNTIVDKYVQICSRSWDGKGSHYMHRPKLSTGVEDTDAVSKLGVVAST